jgi:hypothetical protein
MLSYLGWLNLLDRITTMVEVVFKKVLGIKVRSERHQYFLPQIERRWGKASLTIIPPPKVMSSV